MVSIGLLLKEGKTDKFLQAFSSNLSQSVKSTVNICISHFFY